MTRIDDRLIRSAIFLYPNPTSAKKREAAGGSGFLVFVPLLVNKEYGHVYAVTNRHIISGSSIPTLRLNSFNGLATIQTKPDEWICGPDEDDLAVRPIQLSPKEYQYSPISVDEFISPTIVYQFGIGPGDDSFLIGRFVGHEGEKKNIATVRFGNISAMPDEPIKMSGKSQEAFLVECRSIGGYSGSPVFVWIPPFAGRPPFGAHTGAQRGPWLLGVDCGHIRTREEIRTVDGARKAGMVGFNSAMAGVIPAWRLLRLLDKSELAEQRDRDDAELSNGKVKPNSSLE